MLAWYAQHGRDLPWRHACVDPYRVFISEIMLQQTTVGAVAPRYQAFLDRWPTVRDLAAAPIESVLEAWAGLGYYARARNLHRAAQAVVAQGGDFPDTEDALRALPGVGAYTAAAIAAIAFGRRAVVVDANIERVMARLDAIETPFPNGKSAARAAAARRWPDERSGDFAQALMDLGALICTPREPSCGSCPVAHACAAHASGDPEVFPKRAPKPPRPQRRGAAFALFDKEGRVFLEQRPAQGLLGGMLGLPGTPWAEEVPVDIYAFAPASARWRDCGAVRHLFTHFALDLQVYAGEAAAPPQCLGVWRAPDGAGAPTVMRKAIVLAASWRATTR